jgi:hypothetical protein
VIAIVVSSIVVLAGLAAVAAGGAALVFQTQRDSNGYLMTGTETYSTGSYAVVSDSYRGGTAADWFALKTLLGTVRIETQSTQPVFVGIGPAAAVTSYLAGVGREELQRFDTHHGSQLVDGGAPAAAPTAQTFWAATAVGSGKQVLSWKAAGGDWRVVLMRPDGAAGVQADVRIGARFPHLVAIGAAALGGGLLLLLLAGAGIVAATRKPPAANR